MELRAATTIALRDYCRSAAIELRAIPQFRSPDISAAALALFDALLPAMKAKLARTATITITTISSTRENPRGFRNDGGFETWVITQANSPRFRMITENFQLSPPIRFKAFGSPQTSMTQACPEASRHEGYQFLSEKLWRLASEDRHGVNPEAFFSKGVGVSVVAGVGAHESGVQWRRETRERDR